MKKEFVLTKPVNHVAFIMDGNGRWAKKRLLPRHLGHKEGCKRIIEIFNVCKKYHIKVMTLYAFSTENWNRPQDEINYLFSYLEEFFNDNIDTFMKDGVRVQVMGDTTKLPLSTQKTLQKALSMTKDNDTYVFNIALNYGSKQEIIKAVKEIATDCQDGKVKIGEIDEKLFDSHLYTANLPPIDLMIRTSGECRLSNYLLYQLAYSEMIFTPTYWPDFKPDKFVECLDEFCQRDRRFGSIKE